MSLRVNDKFGKGERIDWGTIWTCPGKRNNDKIVKKKYEIRVEGNREPKNKWIEIVKKDVWNRYIMWLEICKDLNS